MNETSEVVGRKKCRAHRQRPDSGELLSAAYTVGVLYEYYQLCLFHFSVYRMRLFFYLIGAHVRITMMEEFMGRHVRGLLLSCLVPLG